MNRLRQFMYGRYGADQLGMALVILGCVVTFVLSLILYYYDKANEAKDDKVDVEKILSVPVREKIGRAKNASNTDFAAEYEMIRSEIDSQLAELRK